MPNQKSSKERDKQEDYQANTMRQSYRVLEEMKKGENKALENVSNANVFLL